jgi:putative flippase GtrA
MGSRLELFPLAETVRWRGKLLPRYGWYMLSGAVCDIGQFILYKTLWSSFGLPTFSWTAAYVLSIALRQEAHKVFVFGHYEGSWWRSLWRFYCVYFLTVATSMPVNWALVHLMSCLPTQLLTLGIAESTYVRARGRRACRTKYTLPLAFRPFRALFPRRSSLVLEDSHRDCDCTSDLHRRLTLATVCHPALCCRLPEQAYFGTTIYTGIFSYLRLKANWRRVRAAAARFVAPRPLEYFALTV